EVQYYRSQLFATSTKATYKTHRNTYFRFSNHMGYTPVPVQTPHLLQYAAFLARSLKPQSLRGYLNIIGILHKEDHLSLIGVDPKLYAGHSFRRGGASFAYQSGVPIELIKALGD
ncbi:unnamed protein product, partial [Porites lobata]